jgi:hypothetical protein
MQKKPTRFYSKKQEKKVAKAVKGKRTKNSGATMYDKGDVKTDEILFECKTHMKPLASITIKREWLDTLKEEGFAKGKVGVLVSDFGDGVNFYTVDERFFKEAMRALKAFV